MGDHVIIGMDANEDVRTGEVNDLLSEAGLREVIIELHQDESPPATHNRNTKREPIDGLWATCGVNITNGGYLAFGDASPSDHRLLWFEITYSVAFGQRPSAMVSAQPKRLKSKDPRLTKRCHKRVISQLESQGFHSRFQAFKLQTKLAWTTDLEIQCNKLHNEQIEVRKSVENNLRKLCMGGVPWSPEIGLLRDTIELWTMIVRRKSRLKVSVKRIRRFLKKLLRSATLSNALSKKPRLSATRLSRTIDQLANLKLSS